MVLPPTEENAIICDKFWSNIEIWYSERPNGTRYFQNTLLIIASKFCDMSRHHFLSRKYLTERWRFKETLSTAKRKVFPFLNSYVSFTFRSWNNCSDQGVKMSFARSKSNLDFLYSKSSTNFSEFIPNIGEVLPNKFLITWLSTWPKLYTCERKPRHIQYGKFLLYA